MIKRAGFHLFHFLVLNALLFLAVYFYFALTYPKAFVLYSVVIAYKFIARRVFNFTLIAFLVYFMAYLAGIIKFTLEQKFFRMVGFLKEMFKFVLILGMVSFIEFFVFYQNRIGRLIYVYFLVLYGIYYYIYLKSRSQKGPRGLLWLADVPVEKVMGKYVKKQSAYRVYKDGETVETGIPPDVVYQDGCIDDHTSESLIRNKLAGLRVVELVELVENEAGKIPLDYVNIHWFLEKFDVVDSGYFRSSRMFNIFMGFILLAVLFPIGIIFAIIHKLFSAGPIFFIQERTGLHERPFKMIKFRTMVRNAESGGARFAGKNDKRITPVGKFMRRFRIDEIPQFLNVIKGEMGLVGPRPERQVFIENLSKEIPYYKLRLLVPPGLTGWAQVNGVYAGSDIEEHKEKLEYDLYYIKNRSIGMDLLILLRTIKTIIQGKGE